MADLTLRNSVKRPPKKTGSEIGQKLFASYKFGSTIQS
jgi:hypothetical protein